ncbi:GNAT family N-acetyltransferase [Gemmobacter denitrificans]|uniref:GNAT family N-acetyltransferase n=1 Tax=Gemmobacter denitrificans TaxID=3123040 RepID=A0ABU8BPV1_9RHOB
MELRDANPQDRPAWESLWSDYLRFYKVDLSPAVTAHTWNRLMDPASPMSGRFAFVNGVMQGFALFHHHCSTWVAGDDCYLEDLFVADTARGLGIGRALIDDLAALARARGWHRLYWHTDEGNARARALYDSYAPYDGHVRYRLKLQG